MIYTMPMITSPNISANLLPGLCKITEKHLLIYRIDDIVKGIRKSGKLVKLAAVASVVATGAYLLKKLDDLKKNEPGVHVNEAASPVTTAVKSAISLMSKPSGKRANIETPNVNLLSLEPTWVHIESNKGPTMLGIKVIPFPLSSTSKFTDLISSDLNLKNSSAKIQSFTRKIKSKLMTSFARKATRSKEFNNLAEDPFKDVILGDTLYGKDIFLTFNKMDLEDDLTQSSAKLSKLQSLGWTSFILCDDISKRAYFCMKEYKGLCSLINYQLIYSAFGAGALKVYQDLEDVKKSSPFFRQMNVKSSKLLGESYVNSLKEELDNILIEKGLF